MNLRSLIILISFLLWGGGSTYWYVCKIKGFCQPTQTNIVNKPEIKKEKESTIKKVAHSLMYFIKGKSEPVINDTAQWEAEVKSIKQLQAEGKKLHIEVPYYAGENNTTRFDNLGLARANALKQKLSTSIDTALIVTKGKQIGDQKTKTPDFIEYDKNWFKWLINNDFVQELGQKTIVHFPYNSTKAIKNEAILSYLDKVANNLKIHPELIVLIIGHTDNSGSATSNKFLGLKRAKRIEALLLKKGISPDKIVVKSEGETQPIADNNTNEGRQKNRRVEISYIKK